MTVIQPACGDKRLRTTVLTAHQLRENFCAPLGCLEMVHREFVRDLEVEPCVLELGEIKRELLDPDGKKVASQK